MSKNEETMTNVELTPEEEAKINEMTQNGELEKKPDNKVGFFGKVKRFCSKHWKKAAITAGGAALVAAGYFIGKATSGRDEDYELVGQMGEDEGDWDYQDPAPVEKPEEPTVD